ncbi:MAG: hypothetical protein H6695_15490 [Deferribacteres bacterium]|nr:hypothetical protein [Deferribacteres bacterium]
MKRHRIFSDEFRDWESKAQASPGRKSWGTIFLHTSNNRLEHCTVEYGDWGIKVYGYSYFT